MTPSDIVLDYTGGTKAFTAAMALAGASSDRRIEYVSPKQRGEDGRQSRDTEYEVIEVDISYRVVALRH